MTREELIAALEAATEPSLALDLAIKTVCGVPHDRRYLALQYTASLDAALTLVPEGSFWNVLTEGEGDGYLAAAVTREGADAGQRFSWLKGPTPAIALCIAALKARAA